MRELPQQWWTDEIDGDSWVLLGVSVGSLHVVVPPGVRCRPGEPDHERVLWRHAVWIAEDDEDPPAVCVDVPDSVACLQTSEVVEMLPRGHHDFVRQAMARQISRAVTFSLPINSSGADEHHARQAGRTLSWIADQLSNAFPSESWFKPKVPAMWIPNTIEEFLREVPTRAPEGEQHSRVSIIYWYAELSRRRRARVTGFVSKRKLTWLVVSAGLHRACDQAAAGLRTAAPWASESLDAQALDDARLS